VTVNHRDSPESKRNILTVFAVIANLNHGAGVYGLAIVNFCNSLTGSPTAAAVQMVGWLRDDNVLRVERVSAIAGRQDESIIRSTATIFPFYDTSIED